MATRINMNHSKNIRDIISDSYSQILTAIGEDPKREGLVNTPLRAAKAMEYMTHGYHVKLDDIINGAIFESEMDEMVIVKNIELYSLCEHHMLPFTGKCHVGYIPNGKVLGLSKIPRIVDMFSKRLQIQENLTKEIADCILNVTGAKGVGVVIEAQHLCMMMRGVEKQHPSMVTSMMLGLFRKNDRTRGEFLKLI